MQGFALRKPWSARRFGGGKRGAARGRTTTRRRRQQGRSSARRAPQGSTRRRRKVPTGGSTDRSEVAARIAAKQSLRNRFGSGAERGSLLIRKGTIPPMSAEMKLDRSEFASMEQAEVKQGRVPSFAGKPVVPSGSAFFPPPPPVSERSKPLIRELVRQQRLERAAALRAERQRLVKERRAFDDKLRAEAEAQRAKEEAAQQQQEEQQQQQ